jgi:hypothetical protein
VLYIPLNPYKQGITQCIILAKWKYPIKNISIYYRELLWKGYFLVLKVWPVPKKYQLARSQLDIIDIAAEPFC